MILPYRRGFTPTPNSDRGVFTSLPFVRKFLAVLRQAQAFGSLGTEDFSGRMSEAQVIRLRESQTRRARRDGEPRRTTKQNSPLSITAAKNRKIAVRCGGFTLIELLVVIAIIAVLSVVVILTLNPAELLRQSRDSSRVHDLGTLKTGLSLYLADVATNPNLANGPFGYGGCYLSTIGSNGTTTAKCGVFALSYTNVTDTTTLYRKIDANGWVPVHFDSISSGAPFGSLPIDPTNNQSYYYSYAATSTSNLTFEIDAPMESSKYSASGTRDVESIDGGDNNNVYEAGTNLTL